MRINGDDFRKAPLAVLQRVDAATSRLLQIAIDEVTCIYLNDAALIRAVLETQWPDFRKEFGYKKSRDLIQPDLFSPNAVWPTAQETTGFFSSVQSVVSHHVAKSGARIADLYVWCLQLTMSIFLQTLLNGCVVSGTPQQELEETTIVVIRLLSNVILQFPSNIDCIDELPFESHALLRDYSHMFQQHPTCEYATPGRSMTTLLAGYEQMASIMYWLIVHYAERPLNELPGIEKRQYVNEVIRLHSPIWTIMRRPKHDVRIEDFMFQKGCVVLTSPWLMARNPIFFPDPDHFRPEHWNRPIDAFAFFPFSHGPRACKGERFVRFAMYALLDELTKKQQITCVAPTGDIHHIKVSATPAQQVEVSLS